MQAQLTYKMKNRLLLLIAVVMFYLVYIFAIKQTLTAYKEYTASESQLHIAVNAPTLVKTLESRLMEVNTVIGSQQSGGEQNTEQALLELITNYCQKQHLVLREFPETVVTRQGDLLVETNQFEVEGNFSSLVSLVYILEQKHKLGKVASVRYQLKKDMKTKEMALTASIYLQNIKQQ